MGEYASLYSSSLKVSIKPLQSSFFAGEEFVCTITFTNTNPRVTHTQPIPQTSTFASNPFSDSDHPDDSSLAPDRLHLSPLSTRRVVSGAPFHNNHSKSKSVDIRALTSNQFHTPSKVSENHAQPVPASIKSRSKRLLRQLDGETVPERKGLIGIKHPLSNGSSSFDSGSAATPPILITPWSIASQAFNNPTSSSSSPSLKGQSKHSKSASVIETTKPASGSPHKSQSGLGLGLPSKGRPSQPSKLINQASATSTDDLLLSATSASPLELSSSFSGSKPTTTSSSSSGSFIRKSSGVISAKHPHSRKKSVAQAQAEDLTEAFELDHPASQLPSHQQRGHDSISSLTPSTPSTPGIARSDLLNKHDGASPWGPSSSTSSSSDFYRLGKNDTMESVFRDSINDWSQGMRRQPTAGASSSRGTSPIYPGSELLAPGSEKILWSFVQLDGSVEIDQSIVKPGDFDNLKRRLAYGDVPGTGSFGVGGGGIGGSSGGGSMPGTPRTIGGGNMGHGDEDEDGRNGDGGFGFGLGGYLRHALGTTGGGSGGIGGNSRTGSVGMTRMGGSSNGINNSGDSAGGGGGGRLLRDHKRTGSTLQDNQDRTLSSRSVPTFSTPPSILAVDLVLGPGESRSYTFRIQLPIDLPPSHHGRAIRLNYNLRLGTNKIDADVRSRKAQRSRLIQVPVRIYNHVAASGVRPFYDLMNPIILLREQAKIEAHGDVQDIHHVTRGGGRRSEEKKKRTDPIKTEMSRNDLEKYAQRLKAVGIEEANELLLQEAAASTAVVVPHGLPPLPPASSTLTKTDSTEQQSCKAAVEALSRSSTKVSYDISKDGKVAAVLTLVKSKYRLGDTVMGIISINEKKSIARIARIAATLETYEEVQPSMSQLSATKIQRTTREVYAEHHESVLDKGRVTFSLPIPSGATPEFVTSGVKLNWTVKLSFLTICLTSSSNNNNAQPLNPTCSPPSHLLATSPDGYSLYHSSFRAVPWLSGSVVANNPSYQTKLETVECFIPITVLPNSTGFNVGVAEFFA